MLLLTGCTPGTLSSWRPGGSAASQPMPGEFSWARSSYEGVGESAAGTDAGDSQQALLGTQSAKTAAIANLKTKVNRLPVAEGATVGTVMRENIAVRRAVEKYLQTASVVGQRETQPGRYEVRVRASLAPIGDILQQNQYTPASLAPTLQPQESSVPPVS
jgi:hypothetical protein